MSVALDGTDDLITLNSVTLGNPRSYLLAVRPNTQGTSNLGGLFRHGAGTGRIMVRWAGGAALRKLQIYSDRATDGIWVMTNPFATLPDWHWILLTYDGTSTANDPILHTLDVGVVQTLTVGAGLTQSTGPSGAEAQGEPAAFTVGAGFSADKGEGLHAECAAWANRALTASEAAQVLLDGGPLASPRNLYFYWPMQRIIGGTVLDVSGNGRHGTVTGGAGAGAHVPVRSGVGIGS